MKNSYKIIISFLFMLATGFFFYFNSKSDSRTPAAAIIKKSYPQTLSAHISSDVDAPVAPEQSVILTGTISSDIEINQAQYRWHVPDDVSVLSGEIEGSLDLKPETPQSVTLTIVTHDTKNKRIVLSVSKQGAQNARIGAIDRFNTNPSDLDPIHHRRMPPRALNKASSGDEPVPNKAPTKIFQ